MHNGTTSQERVAPELVYTSIADSEPVRTGPPSYPAHNVVK